MEKYSLDEEDRQHFFADMPMYILSNKDRIHGAAAILYPGVVEQLALIFQTGFYIIPSSIHEVILLVDNGQENPIHLREIIAEVNRTQVEPEEVLSDSLYYYNHVEKNIQIV